MSPRTDEDLMQAFKSGEGPAFRELFDRYKNPIYGFIRRRIENPGRAEEIAQDVFMALVQNRNGYELRSSFRTYLYRIAMNRVASEFRKNSEGFATQNPAEIATPVEAAFPVREALEKIEPEQKQIVMLREYEGLSYREIADLLKIPVGTVRSKLFRAKLALRELLAPAVAKGV